MQTEPGSEGADKHATPAIQLLGYGDPRLLVTSAFADHDPIVEAYALTLTSAIHASEVTLLDWSMLSEDCTSVSVRPNFTIDSVWDWHDSDQDVEPFALPIGPRTAAALQARRTRAGDAVHGLVFTDPLGDPYTVGDLEALLRLRCDRAGVAPVSWRWLRTNGLVLVSSERPCVTQTLRWRDTSPTGRRLLRAAVTEREHQVFPEP